MSPNSTYTQAKNARRAAAKHLSGTEGQDWHLVQQGDGRFRIEPITESVPAEPQHPEPGHVYALTGGSDDACLSNGNSWAESEVADAESKPAKRRKASDNPYRGAWATAYEQARTDGTLATPPDFSAPTHKRFRSALDKVVEAAQSGDLETLRSLVGAVNPASSSPKAIKRYGDIAIAALERQAELAKPGRQYAEQVAREAEGSGDYTSALAKANID